MLIMFHFFSHKLFFVHFVISPIFEERIFSVQKIGSIAKLSFPYQLELKMSLSANSKNYKLEQLIINIGGSCMHKV